DRDFDLPDRRSETEPRRDERISRYLVPPFTPISISEIPSRSIGILPMHFPLTPVSEAAPFAPPNRPRRKTRAGSPCHILLFTFPLFPLISRERLRFTAPRPTPLWTAFHSLSRRNRSRFPPPPFSVLRWRVG